MSFDSLIFYLYYISFSGWTGKDCSKPCPVGKYGFNCTQSCQCANGEKCRAHDGIYKTCFKPYLIDCDYF